MIEFIKNLLITFVLISAGILTGFLITEVFFRVGPFFIIMFSIPVCIMVGLPLSLMISLLNLKFIFVSSKLFRLVLPLPFVIILAILGLNLYSPSPQALFKRFISEEIPKTVSNIHGAIEYPGIDHIARLTFQISKREYDLLVSKYNCEQGNQWSPLSWPVIKQHSWWDPSKIKKFHRCDYITENYFRFFWYDEVNSICYFIHGDI